MIWPIVLERVFETHALDALHVLRVGALPKALCLSAVGFDELWALRPESYHQVSMFGRRIDTPRWQQAYGVDYRYTGSTNVARPVPAMLRPIHAWARSLFDARLNGLLLNWYDAALGHYIGRHRDSTIGAVAGSPIVVVSFGGSRIFRMRPWRRRGYRDFDVDDGAVLVIGPSTNAAWTHEVPHRAIDVGRRISITLRALHGT